MHKRQAKFSVFFVKTLAFFVRLCYSIAKISKGVSPMGYMELIEHRSGAVPA